MIDRGESRTAATSKMEIFVILVNGFQPLTIITKCSILDVTAVLDPPLMDVGKKHPVNPTPYCFLPVISRNWLHVLYCLYTCEICSDSAIFRLSYESANVEIMGRSSFARLCYILSILVDLKTRSHYGTIRIIIFLTDCMFLSCYIRISE